jgi:hypothetical protein
MEPAHARHDGAQRGGVMRGVYGTIIDGQVQFVYEYDHEMGNEPFVRLAQATLDFVLGLYYHFPLCCVIAYCRDVLDDHAPGVRRQYEVEDAPRVGYVQCVPCATLQNRRTTSTEDEHE